MAISTIKNGRGFDASNYHEYLIDSAGDIENLPVCAPGSRAYTANKSLCYCLSNSGEWEEETFRYDWGSL
jgi:hypothetical protein